MLRNSAKLQSGRHAGTTGYTAYISALEPRILGQPIEHVRIASAFLLRTARPPVAAWKAVWCTNCAASANASRSEWMAISGSCFI